LTRDHIQRESKEFAFTRLIKCGHCESGITADEKYKKQKNGNVHRYVYYGCTRSRDLHCKGGYIREEELINQLAALFDTIDVNELGIRHKYEEEVARYRKFRKNILGLEREKEVDKEEIDIRTYAKYILKEGTIVEKRQLLANIKSWLKLKNKQIVMEETSKEEN